MHNSSTILITGGTGKIGNVLVGHFLQVGATVIFTSRSADKISAEKDKWGGGDKLHGILVDLEQEAGSNQVTDYLGEHQLRPTCLVNNARNLNHLRLANAPMPSLDGWLGEFRMDVVVPYELTMALVEQSNSQLESVVNVASMYGVVAANPSLYDDPISQSPIHYGVAKAAMIHLTKELAVRLAPRGVRVNAVSYGGVEGRVSEEFKRRYARLAPVGGMLADEDVIGGVDFLASRSSRGTTGHNLVVDGGWTIW